MNTTLLIMAAGMHKVKLLDVKMDLEQDVWQK